MITLNISPYNNDGPCFTTYQERFSSRTANLVSLACFSNHSTNYPCVTFVEASDFNIILLLLRCNLSANQQMLPEVVSLFVKRFVYHFHCDRCACDNLPKPMQIWHELKVEMY